MGANDSWYDRCLRVERENGRLAEEAGKARAEVERLRGIVQADLEEKAEAWGEVDRLRAALRGVVVELSSTYIGAESRAQAIAEIALDSTSPSPGDGNG